MTTKENFAYFLEQLPQLLAEHRGEFVVIFDCKILAFYKSFEEAYFETIKTHKLGTFIIQECVETTKNEYTFYSVQV